MNQSLAMGELLPSRHRRPQKQHQQKRPAAQRGEDLLHGTHQLMKGMKAGGRGQVRWWRSASNVHDMELTYPSPHNQHSAPT